MEPLRTFLGQRVDPRPLGRVRVAIGVLAVLRGLEAGRILSLTHAPGSLHLPIVGWLPPIETGWVAALLTAWLLAAALFAAGWKVPLSGSVLLGAIGYVLLLDQRTYSNHLYLLWLLVLLLTAGGAGRAYALGGRRTESWVPLWAVTLLKLQLSIVYFFSAATKLNVYYLSGSVLCGTMTGWISLPGAWRGPEVCAPLAMLSILVELFLAVAFWSPRWRLAAWVVGTGFHLSIIVLLPDRVRLQLTIFALAMISLYTLFGRLREGGRVPGAAASSAA